MLKGHKPIRGPSPCGAGAQKASHSFVGCLVFVFTFKILSFYSLFLPPPFKSFTFSIIIIIIIITITITISLFFL